MADTCCILVNYKNTEDTLEALSSMSAIVGQGLVDVVVVDNESSEASLASLKSFSEFSVEIIPSEENRGFAGGVNLGANYASENDYKFIWLLNNDCVLESDALTPLLDVANRLDVGIVGSLITYYPDKDKVWFAGGKVHSPLMVVQHLLKGQSVAAVSEQPQDVNFITGCSMLIPTAVWNRVGGFDESLFLYAEDLDLCFKVRQAGLRLVFQPTSIIHHKVSMASGGEFNPLREYYNTRNGYVMIKRYVGLLPLRLVAYSLRAVWDLWRIAKSLSKSGQSPAKAISVFCRAFGDFCAQRFGRKV